MSWISKSLLRELSHDVVGALSTATSRTHSTAKCVQAERPTNCKWAVHAIGTRGSDYSKGVSMPGLHRVAW